MAVQGARGIHVASRDAPSASDTAAAPRSVSRSARPTVVVPERLLAALDAHPDEPVQAVLAPAGWRCHALQAADTAVVSLLCAGQLPPAFVEYALRSGAQGVLIAACPDGGCEYRLGTRLTLERMQGVREPQFETVQSHGHETKVFKGWKQVSPGAMTPLQYDQAVGDLVGFLQWMAEPVQNSRVRVGVWVLLFLGLFTVIAWRLNVAYWKDIH